MNVLSSLDETYREYSLAPTDDLIRFWRSKVAAGCQSGKGVHIDSGVLEVHLLVTSSSKIATKNLKMDKISQSNTNIVPFVQFY